jgi:hypothetical protein
MRLADVARPDAAAEAELGAVQALHDLVDGVEGHDRGDGPKISSLAMCMSSLTSANTVGETNPLAR